MKNTTTGWRHLYHAACYAAKGLQAAWQQEAAFRQELVITIIGTIISYCLAFSTLERLLLLGSMLLILMIELINSAIEATVDRMGEEFHPLAGRAKDMAAAAVLLSCLFSLFCWLTLLIKHYV